MLYDLYSSCIIAIVNKTKEAVMSWTSISDVETSKYKYWNLIRGPLGKHKLGWLNVPTNVIWCYVVCWNQPEVKRKILSPSSSGQTISSARNQHKACSKHGCLLYVGLCLTYSLTWGEVTCSSKCQVTFRVTWQ